VPAKSSVTEGLAPAQLDVSRETLARLEQLHTLVARENERQNLVSAASLADFWTRHILDSAQLAALAPCDADRWADLGTGGGFPGLVVPFFHPAEITLIEARRLRAGFLSRAALDLGLSDRVSVRHARVEAVREGPFDVISARAFAPLDRLLRVARHLSTEKTVWVLPKGRTAKTELEAARASWQGGFRIEPSVTDPEAGIIVATGVRPRSRSR
jgi:16S rRNA (guanine527-N7)-methyltransferase